MVSRLGNGSVFLNINFHNLCPVQMKVLMNCVVCCLPVKALFVLSIILEQIQYGILDLL